MKSKRVTIMMDEELDKKLRSIQAKKISRESKSVSYSSVVNEVLKKGLQ